MFKLLETPHKATAIVLVLGFSLLRVNRRFCATAASTGADSPDSDNPHDLPGHVQPIAGCGCRLRFVFDLRGQMAHNAAPDT